MSTTGETAPNFLKGLLLAWSPMLLVMIPIIVNLFKVISTRKTTGLGAVAGGISEGLITFSIVAVVICELYGTILLLRTFSAVSLPSRILAAVSIASAVTFAIAFVGAVGWMMTRSRIQ